MKPSSNRPVAFVLTATNHGSMLVNRNDFHSTRNGSYGVGYQLFKNSSFDPFGIDFALQLLEIGKPQYSEIGVPVPDYLSPSIFGSLEISKRASNEFIGQAIDYDKPQVTRSITTDSLGIARGDFIEIDFEGMELEALLGAEPTILRCLPRLLIEKIKSDEDRLPEMLNAWSYQLFPLGLNILAYTVQTRWPKKSMSDRSCQGAQRTKSKRTSRL